MSTTDDEASEGEARQGSGLARRTLLGGAAIAAAAGVVGVGVGAAVAGEGEEEDAPSAAAGIAVEPVGELVASDVQAALVDVYDRTSATFRLTDLKVAHELVDDFPPTAHEAPGALGWFREASGDGAGLVALPREGGVLRLSTGASGTGRVGMHLGLDQHARAPVFTMEWRLTVYPDTFGGAAVAFGAIGSLEDPKGGGPGPGAWFAFDPASGPAWVCRTAGGGEVSEVVLDRRPNGLPHRFGITCDGGGLVRFWYDDAEVASIGTTLPGEDDLYGQGLVVASAAQASDARVEVDWFYLRREVAR